MGEWEDRLNQVLNDPKQMEQITQMAQSLLGGGQTDASPLAGLTDLGIDPGLLGRVGRLLNEEQGEDKARQELLAAMKPYLSPRRREKLDRAMKLARLSHLARLALGEENSHV